MTGYVAECAIKYRYCTNCKGLIDNIELSRGDLTTYNVGTHFSFTSDRGKDWSERVLQELSSSIVLPNYLQKLGRTTNVEDLSNEEEIAQDMQSSWDPTIRYHYETNGLILNESDVKSFFDTTFRLLKNLDIL